MPEYCVLLRAVQHCTAELTLDAPSEDDARRIAEGQGSCRPGSIAWDLSDPEDVQVEHIETTSNVIAEHREEHRMLALSTAHLSESTLEDMIAFQSEDIPAGTCQKGEYGAFVPVLDPYPNGVPHTCPADLLGCIEYARANGFTWLMFDCDAPIVSAIPLHQT